MDRAYVYIDGFNLFYGCLKGSDCKWLDVSKLCSLYFPEYDIVKIKYYTAYVSKREDNPEQVKRQRVYTRALKTIPNLTIHLGRFLSEEKYMYLADSEPGNPEFAKVVKTEEKGSDVNLATHLLHDGVRGLYDVAIVISNDSDLLEPVRIVRRNYHKTVGLLNPQQIPSGHLRRNTDFVKQIRRGALLAAQFPDAFMDAKGKITKPDFW